MDQRICRDSVVACSAPPDYNCSVVDAGSLLRQRQPRQSLCQNQLRLVLLIFVLIFVLLFVGFLALFSTDKVLSRTIDEHLRRRQPQQLINCSPCTSGTTTSTDSSCCELDTDLSTFIHKVGYFINSQRVSVASYASAVIATVGMPVRLSVCLSVCHAMELCQNDR